MRFCDFKTFGEPTLELARNALGSLLSDFSAPGMVPYTLALLGTSGTGKTALARVAWDRIAGYGGLAWEKLGEPDPTGRQGYFRRESRSCGWHYWPDISDGFKAGEFWPCDDIPNEWFAVLDDVGADYDPNRIAAGKLDLILRRSQGRWRIVTSNLLLKQIKALDTRIASWLIRDENKVVEITAPDYATR